MITYLNSTDDSFRQITFIPATKINPSFKFKLKLQHDGLIHYGYSLTSGKDSQQIIVSVLFDPVSSIATSLPDIPLNAPPGKVAADMIDVSTHFETTLPWRGFMGYSNGQMSFRVGWNTKVANGFRPASNAVFGFKSRDLPGIIKAEVRGYAPDSREIPGEETQDAKDGGFGQQYTELVDKMNFVPRPVAVPSIVVPTPFNAAVLLDRIQTQTHTWIAMQLLDATFSSQLDRYLTAASDAYRRNQPKAGKEHIHSLRKMLKNEHESLDRDDEKEDTKAKGTQIDRLAARVLDFDLKYVLKRMDND